MTNKIKLITRGQLREFYRIYNALPKTPPTGHQDYGRNGWNKLWASDLGGYTDAQRQGALKRYLQAITIFPDSIQAFRRASADSGLQIAMDLTASISSSRLASTPNAEILLEAKVIALINAGETNGVIRGTPISYSKCDFEFATLDQWNKREYPGFYEAREIARQILGESKITKK